MQVEEVHYLAEFVQANFEWIQQKGDDELVLYLQLGRMCYMRMMRHYQR